jgi:hypothetical protein
MDNEAPTIYVRSAARTTEPLFARVLAFAIAGCCLAVLIVAVRLPPSHAGVATHRQLGLPECTFLARTGLPCVSCGMTTSFSWFVRGNLLASFYVQPMGAVLAILTCCAVWVGFYVACTGRPIYRLLGLIPSRYTLLPLLGFTVLAWGWKILIHLTGHDGW